MLDVTSHFLNHTSCPKCGSKDNRAVYSSGSSYCFGCGYFTKSDQIPQAQVKASSRQVAGGGYPDDVSNHYPRTVIEWIQKYDLGPEDLIRHNVLWSPGREQLIYTFYGAGKDVVLWQARNFKSGTTHKRRFFTGGTPESVIAKYSAGEGKDTCVVVEDCISGLKVSYSGSDGIPCFGATMSREKIARIAKLYKKMVVWLDHDKYSMSQKIVLQAASLGMVARAVYTEDDPKEYSIAQIREYTAL